MLFSFSIFFTLFYFFPHSMTIPLLSGWRDKLSRGLLLGGSLLVTMPALAQTADTYALTSSTGTYTPLPAATATNVSTIQADDQLSGTIPLGFSFTFDGTAYTQVKVSSNGWLTFNTAATANSLTNDLATGAATERPRLAPFWDDLNGSSGTAQYAVTGTAPNRTFTFEWSNWFRFGNTGGPSFSMQVQLTEGTNVVRYVYTQLAGAPITGATASIGLSGVGTGNGTFLSLNNSTATPTTSSTTETTTISDLPATGQIYTFTPPAPAACPTPRNLATVGTTATSASVSYTVTNATPGPFTIAYGAPGFNPNAAPSSTNVYLTTTATGTTGTISGLTASTAYQFFVRQNCGGTNGNSSYSSGSTFTTACLTPTYATLPLTESFENTWISRCGTNDAPSNSWRNTPVTGNNSWRRDDDGASAGWTSPTAYIYTPVSSVGSRSARFHTGWVQSGIIGTLDLFVNLSTAGAKRLSFDVNNSAGSDSLIVELSTNGGISFSNLGRYGVTGTGFVTQVLPISATSATSVIRFRGRGDYGSNDIGLDNLILESATGCLTPASLTATTTTTTASLSWLTGGTGTYTLVYGPTGFNPALPTGPSNVYTTVSGLTAPPYAITGLAPGTTYQFYVTANCGAGTNSGTAGPQSFTTQIVNDNPCGATTLTVSNTCNPLATTTFGATPTTGIAAGTCANFPTTTPADVWYQFTTAATGPTSTAVRITVTGAAANTLRGYSATACAGPFTFLACSSASDGVTAAPLLDMTNLTPSTTYYVRVGAYSSFQPVLGNFTICATPVPNCPAPIGLAVGTITNTTAVLNWTTATTSTGSTFTVVYGPAGFTPPSGTGSTTVTGITAQTTTITNLQPNTNYAFYVQQVCGGFNGSSTLTGPIAFTTPLTAPLNDEPCGAIGLGTGPRTGSTVGALTSAQNGIITPVCSPASAPKDVWFSFVASATTASFTLTGTPAGMVRVYASPSCSAGPFALVSCASSGANNTALSAPVTATGLTVGTRYYIAVSGYGSSDTAGAFTITPTAGVLAARAQADSDALLVYPNPSSTGQLTLKLALGNGRGQAALLNALGQVVRTTALTAAPEQTLDTRTLATGVYTLRVEANGQVLTRKVVLE
jgi:hypothetical protein